MGVLQGVPAGTPFLFRKKKQPGLTRLRGRQCLVEVIASGRYKWLRCLPAAFAPMRRGIGLLSSGFPFFTVPYSIHPAGIGKLAKQKVQTVGLRPVCTVGGCYGSRIAAGITAGHHGACSHEQCHSQRTQGYGLTLSEPAFNHMSMKFESRIIAIISGARKRITHFTSTWLRLRRLP